MHRESSIGSRGKCPSTEDGAQLKLTQFQYPDGGHGKRSQITYSQEWKAYDAAQCNELGSFMKLLVDLCTYVHQPDYEFGRPTLPLSDMVFVSALKVYSTFSLRRFISYMKKAVEEGHIETYCSYSTVSNYMRKEELTPILLDLIKISGLPLASVETSFGVDSSGFATTRFGRYYSHKYGRDMTHKTWIKVHVSVGLKTNIVAAVRLTAENSGDSPHFKPLIEQTAQVFDLKEAVADRAYSSRENLQFVENLGAKVFIPFKKNTKALSEGSPAWNRMWHYFMLYRDDFMKHYHKRSNVETTFHMLKTKFKDNVRSKDKIAQYNEILLKILCHNICVLIQEMHELGIESDFTRRAEM